MISGWKVKVYFNYNNFNDTIPSHMTERHENISKKLQPIEKVKARFSRDFFSCRGNSTKDEMR